MDRLTLDKLPAANLRRMDFETLFVVSRSVIAAERAGLFRTLGSKKRTMHEICEDLSLHPKYLQILLDILVSVGLLERSKELYWNSHLVEKYFVRDRSIHWTRQFSKECQDAYAALTVLEDMLASGRSHWMIRGEKKDDYLESMSRDPDHARDFTQMLYHHHQADAAALASHLDLSEHESVLDVGGGSGVMSMHLLKRFPHLRASVLDIAPVCRFADELIDLAGLSGRMSTCPGDFHRLLPPGHDVVLCADITGELTTELLDAIHDYLPEGGLLLVVDRFMSSDHTQPLDRLAFQFLDGFSRATQREMESMLEKSGFAQVTGTIFYGDVCVIRGSKVR